jgi:hypothetical protein
MESLVDTSDGQRIADNRLSFLQEAAQTARFPEILRTNLSRSLVVLLSQSLFPAKKQFTT